MPSRNTIHERSLRSPSRPNKRRAWAASATGRIAAAGQPSSRAIGWASRAPAQPKLPLTLPLPWSWVYASAASAPARKIPNRRSTIPRISRASADCEGLSCSFRPELRDLSVLVDRDHRIGVHFRGGDEVVTKSCFFERLSVGRFFEDFRDVVAIFFFNQHRGGRCVVYLHRIGALGNRPDVAPRACGILEGEASLFTRADDGDVRIRAGRDLHHGQHRCKVDVRGYDNVTGTLDAQQGTGAVGGGDEDGLALNRLGSELLRRVAQIEARNGVHLLLARQQDLGSGELLGADDYFIRALERDYCLGAVPQGGCDGGRRTKDVDDEDEPAVAVGELDLIWGEKDLKPHRRAPSSARSRARGIWCPRRPPGNACWTSPGQETGWW